MTKNEIILQYIGDLQTKVPESPARDARIEMLNKEYRTEEQKQKEANEYVKQFWEWENDNRESIAFFAYLNGMNSI